MGWPEVLSALAGEFGSVAVLPVLPRAGAPAIRVLVRAVKGGKPAPGGRLSRPDPERRARPADGGRGSRAAGR